MFNTNQFDPHARAVSLFEDYGDRLKFGGEEKDEALQNAIEYTFRNDADLNHLDQADLYAKLYESLSNKPDPRMLLVIVEGAIREWASI